jgi:hypothetical protein
LKTAVSASAGGAFSGIEVAFKASTDYQQIESGSTNSSEKFTKSTAVCQVYSANVQGYTPPPFSDNFLRGVDEVTSLPYNETNLPAYRRFIDSFGTHYIRRADFGGMFGEQSTFSSSAWAKYQATKLDIKAEASASAFGATAALSVMTSVQRERVRKAVYLLNFLYYKNGDWLEIKTYL